MNFKKNWKRFWTLSRSNGGFTLVELIVVIAILAILAGVAVPAYSGYINKANEAADNQLLAAVNTAFAAACLENNTDAVSLTAADAKAPINDNGTIGQVLPYPDDFLTYFASNTGAAFKVYKSLYFENGVFKGNDGDFGAYTGLYETLRATYGDEIATLVGSNLGQIGATTLVTKTDEMVSWAVQQGLAGLAGDNFNKALAGYLGVNVDGMNEKQVLAALETALDETAGSDDAKRAEVYANGMVLYAAQNSSNLDRDTLVSNWAGSVVDDMLNNASSSAMSEGAAIYGLYLAYAKENGIEPEGTAVQVMGTAMGALSNTGEGEFGAWVNSDAGAKELEAYKAAMTVMAGAATDSETTSNLLANGYTDPDVLKLLGTLLGG